MFRYIFSILMLLLFAGPLFPNWKPSDYKRTTYRNFRQNRAFSRNINFNEIDYGLLNAAIHFATNEIRVRHGRKPVPYALELERAAWHHSRRMVQFNFFSHGDHRRYPKRFRRAGIANPAIAENIAVAPYGGRVTYLKVAQNLIKIWMNSSGHRSNMLSNKPHQMGCGAYHYKKGSWNWFKAVQVWQWFGKIKRGPVKDRLPHEGGDRPDPKPIPNDPRPKPAPLDPVKPVTGSGSGLNGYYYSGKNFQTLRISRIDGTINFDWGGDSPHHRLHSDNFSVRWKGFILPARTGEYTFYTVSDDGVRLWVNGRRLIDEWNDHASREDSGTIYLQAGKKYKIRLEFYENGGGAICRLFWSSRNLNKEIIPKKSLYPAQTGDKRIRKRR